MMASLNQSCVLIHLPHAGSGDGQYYPHNACPRGNRGSGIRDHNRSCFLIVHWTLLPASDPHYGVSANLRTVTVLLQSPAFDYSVSPSVCHLRAARPEMK